MKKSKVRLLTKTLAVITLLAPTGGQALGIGEIQLHSALNQNLDAEISLKLSGESVSDIKVRLAAPEKFEEAGVSWSYFLSKIKFETIAQSSTAAVIKITSREALKEPFLDFLLEVSWPKGNLYREFTVLVDPPADYSEAAASVSAPIQSYAQPSAVMPRVQAYRHQQNRDGEYGPTLSQDTLWRIAERARAGSDVSAEQMMLAIYEANPHAFYQDNAYALTAGKMLTIPEREEALKLSRSQALAEFNRHTQAWKNRLSIARAEGEKPREKQLKLVAPVDVTIAESAVVEPVADAASKKTPATTDKTASSAVVAAGGDSDAGTAALSGTAAQSKLVELEKQLAMMQELIELKDQQLAALQGQVQASPAAQEPEKTDELSVAPSDVQAAALPEQAVAPVAPAEPPVDPAQPIRPVQPAEPVKPIQPVQPAPQPKADSALDSYYLFLGGAGALALALFGGLWWRKRKIDEETNTESMFASSLLTKPIVEDNSQFSAPVIAEESQVNEPGVVGESSFLSEFTPSDFDSFDTDQGEIDPISEADVYLAYGRYQQAEELIRQAIKDQPNRDECKLKLLEVFYANEDKAAFQTYANELAAAGKVDDLEFWEKAAEMGREICPDSVLFSSGDDLFSVDDGVSAENDVESVSGDEVPGTADADAENTSFAKLSSEDVDQDAAGAEEYGLDFDFAPPGAEEEAAAGDQPNNQAMDFDLSSFSAELEETDEGDIKAGMSSVDTQIESIDFESSLLSKKPEQSDQLDSGVIASTPKPGKSPGVDAQVDDFDLSSFSLETEEMDHGVIASTTRPPKTPGMHSETVEATSFAMELDEFDQGVIASSMDKGKFSGAEVEHIDFDSFALDKEAKRPEPDDNATADTLSETADKGLEFESFDFDFNGGEAGTKDVNDLDFGALDVDDKELEDVDFSAGGEIDLSDGLDGDFDFDFNFDVPTATGQNAAQQDEFGVSDLTDMDELETKLDLAKAYVDMGDAAAAKDIAREVLERGTDAQKKAAQALIDELN
ncbi:MAG: FimV/HubP family polar landmark protein, partial [Methylobacter sp.]